MVENLKIRAFEAADSDFVFASWLNSFRDEYPNNYVPRKTYYEAQTTAINKILDIANCSILCNKEDEEQIFSWIVWRLEKGVAVISYMFTKTAFRNMGCAKHLLNNTFEEKIGFYTHNTKSAVLLRDMGFFYNPYLEAQFYV